MQILGLLGKYYFVASVVFVKKTSLLFRFTLAILCFRKVLPSSSTPFPLSFRLFLLSSSQDESSPELKEKIFGLW